MPTYRGPAVVRFTAGGRDFALESADCSAHVREDSGSEQAHGTVHEAGRWTAIGVFAVPSDEDTAVRDAFLALPTPDGAPAVFDLVLHPSRDGRSGGPARALRGRAVARRMEGAGRGALLLTLRGVGLPTLGAAETPA
jgi:hypothetical protein